MPYLKEFSMHRLGLALLACLLSLAPRAASAETVCGPFDLNAYVPGCSGSDVMAGTCPTVGLTIWKNPRSHPVIVTQINQALARSLAAGKCVCIDYQRGWGPTMHDVDGKPYRFGSITPTSAPRPCGSR